jgi:hypothetical protein
MKNTWRHREEPKATAIQSRRSNPSSLDRFAYARDDSSGSAKLHLAQFDQLIAA